jgi:sugar-specific transcriptional regulator TrmB
MNEQKIPPEITAILGLTKYEIRILESIPNMGKQISTISRTTKIPRTSLLYILRKLEKRKLVKSNKNGKYTYWRSIIKYLFPKIFNQGVTILKGKEELFSVLEKIGELPNNTRISGIQPSKSIVEVVKKVPLDKINILNKKIKDKGKKIKKVQ